MKISRLIQTVQRTFSFEFFPPKDEISAVDFGINIGQLLNLNPSFVSVTYGAGGSNQERTFGLVDYLQNRVGLNTMAHYTCVGSSRSKILADMHSLSGLGIENVMLLRGDPPAGSKTFIVAQEGFSHASELIGFVRSHFAFSIGAAAYPEKHPEASSMQEDLDAIRRKCNSGADFLLTQFFFDNQCYYRFLTLARKSGITCRIIPGIIPVTNFNQIKRFSSLSGASFPPDLYEKLETHQHDPEKTYQIGVDHAIRQSVDLLENGAPGLHFYTLNKSRASLEVFWSLPRLLR